MTRMRTKHPEANLNITSLMDVLTIVLVFLLKSFAAEGNLMTTADNLILPVSARSQSPQEVSMTVVGDSEWIVVDHKKVIKTEEVRKQEELMVKPVLELLQKKRSEEKEAEMMGVIDEATGKIVVQFDKNMAYDVVTKIMATCGNAGYNNIKFAVTRKGEEG